MVPFTVQEAREILLSTLGRSQELFGQNFWPLSRFNARSFPHRCAPVRDRREGGRAGVFHATDEEEVFAIAITSNGLATLLTLLPTPRGSKSSFRSARLWHTALLSDFCYIDLIPVQKEKLFAQF